MTSAGVDAVGLPRLGVEGAGVVQAVDYPPGARFGPRVLTDYEFLWILRGSAVWTVHEPPPQHPPVVPSSVRLRPGELLLAPAGSTDSFAWDPGVVTRHAWVHFRVLDHAGLPEPSGWPLVRTFVGAPVLEAICDYLVDLGAQSSAMARQRSDQMLGLLLDLFVRGPLTEPPVVTPPVVTAALAAVRRAWLRDGVRLVEVAEMAAAAGVSAGHLYRVFREHYGCGPANALEAIRLSRAAVMVQRSNASLDEVAAATGFANAYHFSRRFRRAYDVPPGAFRKRHATADPLEPVRAAGLQEVARLLAEA